MAEAVLLTLAGMVCVVVAVWLIHGIWYWTRVGWRWARRNDKRGR